MTKHKAISINHSVENNGKTSKTAQWRRHDFITGSHEAPQKLLGIFTFSDTNFRNANRFFPSIFLLFNFFFLFYDVKRALRANPSLSPPPTQKPYPVENLWSIFPSRNLQQKSFTVSQFYEDNFQELLAKLRAISKSLNLNNSRYFERKTRKLMSDVFFLCNFLCWDNF